MVDLTAKLFQTYTPLRTELIINYSNFNLIHLIYQYNKIFIF